MSTYDLIVVARELVYWEALKAFVGTALGEGMTVYVDVNVINGAASRPWKHSVGRLSRRAIRPAGFTAY